jgi:hypothetical protein
MTCRVAPTCLTLAIALAPARAVEQTSSAATPARIFRFDPDGFWLSLHHFLYVLGRAELGTPDRARRAVAGAPADQAQGLTSLSADDQAAWKAAVAFYANGPSKLDTVFDAPLIEVTNALVGLRDDASLPAAIAGGERAALAAAAPIYRQAWWPAHHRANVAWVAAAEPLVAQYGAATLAFITRAYGEPWPAAGYPVNVTPYTNWAGAYSTRGTLLVISSLDSGTAADNGFEITFHEAMHQWDDPIDRALQAAAKASGTKVPDTLSHAIIFFTAGEAVRRTIPGHVPYADANGIWQRGLAPFKAALESAWLPYLNGTGTRDQALAKLVAAL